MRKLIHSINSASDPPQPADRVDRTFDLCWPGLAQEIEQIVSAPANEIAAAAPSSEVPPELPPKQIEMLVYLGKNPESYPEATDFAGIIRKNQTRTQYHVDRLVDRGLTGQMLNMMEPTRYYLTEEGRAFVVERGLV